MTPELTVLTYAALLQCIQFALMAIPANLELGVGKTASPRDLDRLGKPMIELLSVKTARLARAMNNHFEALILFGIAITVYQPCRQNQRYHHRLRLHLPWRARPLHPRLLFRMDPVAVLHLVRRVLRNAGHSGHRTAYSNFSASLCARAVHRL